MGNVFGIVLVIAAAAYLPFVVLSEGAKSAGRWTRRRTVVVGDSPYRRAEAAEELRGGAPTWLRCVCWLGAMGGLATLGFFAPVGLQQLDLIIDHETRVVSVFLFFVSLSSFPAGVDLVRVALKTMRHEPVEDASFLYLYLHHGCVVGVMFLMHLSSGGQVQVLIPGRFGASRGPDP